MKLYLLFILLVLPCLLPYKAQGIRLTKTSSVAKTAQISSVIDRKLMTALASSRTTTSISKNQKKDGDKHDSKPEDKSTQSSSENSKHWKKEFITEQYPDVIDIAGMDYTPARKKSPIHN